MAKDIFNREVDLGQPFSSDRARLLFPGQDQNMLVQSLNITYNQQITRLWELGSARQYFVAGRTSGTANLVRVVGPKPVASDFMEQFGDVCNIQSTHITFDLVPGCGENEIEGGSIKISGVVISQVGYQVQAQDTLVQEQVALMFARLEID